MYTAETTVRVRYAETDKMNVVYHGNYAQYFEVGRVEAMRALGYSYKEMEADGVIMPVVELSCKYLRPAVYDDLLTIKTMLKELTTNHKITFQQEVFNEQGKLLAPTSNMFEPAKAREKGERERRRATYILT